MSRTGTVTFNSIIDIRHIFDVDFIPMQWTDSGIHSGNIQIRINAYFPDLTDALLLFQYPSQQYDLSIPGYGFQVTYADMSRIDLKVTAPDVTPIKWICTSNSGCIESVLGTYNTQAECMTVCASTEKWKCIDPANNTCIRDDTFGTHNSEAECKAASSCQPLPTTEGGNSGMLIGIVGVVALGIMMTANKPQQIQKQQTQKLGT